MGAFVKTCPRRTFRPLAFLLVCLTPVSIFSPRSWFHLHLTEMHRHGHCFSSAEGEDRIICRKCHSSGKSTSGSLDKRARKWKSVYSFTSQGYHQANLLVSLQHQHMVATQWASVWRGTRCQQVTSSVTSLATYVHLWPTWYSEWHWPRMGLGCPGEVAYSDWTVKSPRKTCKDTYVCTSDPETIWLE